ncbi:MAG: hypothetical protein FJ221_11745 [Lentisphaerae bacterium]|nr:hypothetical protein [Lentisphaerota bacterium]
MWGAVAMLAAGSAQASGTPIRQTAVARALPAREVGILVDVGEEYGLSGDELKLLLVIRKIENGGPGVEMGVGSNIRGHRARRYAGQPDLSLRIQARWAAGTIRDRFTGNLESFAKRYCPPKWRHWTSMARHWMTRG